MLACRRSPFFYPQPIADAPLLDGGFIAFSRMLLWLLACPAKGMQNAPYMIDMILHAEMVLDHLADPRAGSLLRVISRRHGTLSKNLQQLFSL